MFQFTISIFLIVGAIAVNRQLSCIQTRKLGYEKNRFLSSKMPGAQIKHSGKHRRFHHFNTHNMVCNKLVAGNVRIQSIAAGSIALIIAMLTISFAIKAASANPVNSLRSE